jgi:nucleoside 2-deoxyribosyltransferase
MTKIYLAIPYTFNADLSYSIANKVAADLMSQGYVVFSPISHSHIIADHLHPDLRYSQSFWMAQDLPLIEWCDEVRVVCIGKEGHSTIANSKGCQSELKKAQELGKPVTIIQYD